MDGQYHMEVDEAVWPVVHPPRKVPVALRDRLKEELDKLVNEGIITLVTEPTKWVSSLVKVNKPEKLRICIDRQDLNKALLRAHYPLPTIEEVETRLSKVRFSVLDAKIGSSGYNGTKSNLISQPSKHLLAAFLGCACHLV